MQYPKSYSLPLAGPLPILNALDFVLLRMPSQNRELHPLGNIGGMVANALEILGDHQKVQCLLAAVRLPRQSCESVPA